MTIDPKDDLINTFASIMVGVATCHAKQNYNTNEFKLLYKSILFVV